MKPSHAAGTRKTPPPGVDHLTPAQSELLKLLGQGLRAAEIAHRNGLPLPIMRARIDDLLTALGVTSQLEAVMLHWDHQRSAHDAT